MSSGECSAWKSRSRAPKIRKRQTDRRTLLAEGKRGEIAEVVDQPGAAVHRGFRPRNPVGVLNPAPRQKTSQLSPPLRGMDNRDFFYGARATRNLPLPYLSRSRSRSGSAQDSHRFFPDPPVLSCCWLPQFGFEHFQSPAPNRYFPGVPSICIRFSPHAQEGSDVGWMRGRLSES